MIFKVEILTPRRLVESGMEVHSLKIPLSNGMVQVLPKHANSIESIDIGILQLFTKDKIQRLFISGGLFKIEDKSIVILAEKIVSPEEIDISEVRAELNEILEQMNHGFEIQEQFDEAFKIVKECEFLIELKHQTADL